MSPKLPRAIPAQAASPRYTERAADFLISRSRARAGHSEVVLRACGHAPLSWTEIPLSHQRSSFDAALELLLAEIAETADYREPMSADEAGAELKNLFRKYERTKADQDNI